MRLPALLALAAATAIPVFPVAAQDAPAVDRYVIAGGIVDGRVQRQPRPAPLQPVVSAAIDLQQHARLGIPLPPPPMA